MSSVSKKFDETMKKLLLGSIENAVPYTHTFAPETWIPEGWPSSAKVGVTPEQKPPLQDFSDTLTSLIDQQLPGSIAVSALDTGAALVRATIQCPHGDKSFRSFPVQMLGQMANIGLAHMLVKNAAEACRKFHTTHPAFNTYWSSYGPAHAPIFAVGGSGLLKELGELVPALNTHYISSCPLSGGILCGTNAFPQTLAQTVIHLNDKHGQKREAIATWLETLDVDITVQPKKQGADIATDEGTAPDIEYPF